jgi:DNA polymerase
MKTKQEKNITKMAETFWDLLEKTQQLIEGQRMLTPLEHIPDFSSLEPEIQSEGSAESGPVDFASLEEIACAVRGCEKCPLARYRTHAVPGEGVSSPQVMIIGEAPGKKEDEMGLPFVGRSGEYLDAWMKAIGLSRQDDLFIGNIVKCRPPENRDPAEEEQRACIGYLERQIELLQPKMILCLGRVAAQILLDTQKSLGMLRGEVHDFNGIPLMATYHPSAVLRYPDKFRRPVWEDLKQLRSLLDEQA